MSAFDCRACGACCIGGMDDGEGFADMEADEPACLSLHHRRRLHVTRFQDGERTSTPGAMTEEFGKICGFLRGDPGRKVSCAIYASRPGVCVKFRPGGRACLESRKALGL